MYRLEQQPFHLLRQAMASAMHCRRYGKDSYESCTVATENNWGEEDDLPQSQRTHGKRAKVATGQEVVAARNRHQRRDDAPRFGIQAA
jgi:hypothetical protein